MSNKDHICWDCQGFIEPDRSNARSGCQMNDRSQEAGVYPCWRPLGSILVWNEQTNPERV